jgi:hypothetical protein
MQDNHSPSPRNLYRSKWIDQNVYERCREVKGDLLYEKIYREASQWIHWTVKGMSPAIRRDGLTFRYYANTSVDMGATALASGFQCLFESAKLLNTHLKLEYNDKLNDIITEYGEFHSRNSGSKTKDN